MFNDYTIFPVGINALTVDFGNEISSELNSKVISLFGSLKHEPVEGVVDIIPAYSSLSIVYDPARLARSLLGDPNVYERIRNTIEQRLLHVTPITWQEGRQLEIPVCYDASFAPDMAYVADHHGLSVDEVISIHSSTTYRVYMIGFLQGFPYMAAVSQSIATPRKPQPRNLVPAGSVGIAGEQTGIYPLASPGGWQLIGRTPSILFEASRKEPVLLRPGDRVQFYPVTVKEYNQLNKV